MSLRVLQQKQNCFFINKSHYRHAYAHATCGDLLNCIEYSTCD